MDAAIFAMDRLAMTDVVLRYAHYFDAGELDAWIDLFTDDARVDVGAGEGDKAALIETISAAYARIAGRQTRHLISTSCLMNSLQTAQQVWRTSFTRKQQRAC